MNKGNRILIYFLIAIIFLMSPVFSLSALPANAEAILSKAQLFGNSSYLSMEVDMLINSSSGEKSRGIDLKISSVDNDYKVYMQIVSPTFLKNMKFLQHNPEDGATLQWIATSRGARKITSSGNDERIFDSDFSASDFASIDTNNYRIEKFSEIVKDESSCYRFELIPNKTDEKKQKKVLFIDFDSYLIREVEYYSENKLVKHYRVLSTKSIDGKMFPEESEMKDLSTGSFTSLIFKKIELPDSIPDRVFHFRNL